MKKLIIFLLFLPISLIAAQLNCELYESKTLSASFGRPVSINGEQITFQFTEPLIGQEFEGQISWDTKYIQLKLKKKADSLGVIKADIWEDPIDQRFFQFHGEAKIVCHIDIKDGVSWKWKETRSNLDDYISVINLSLKSISNLAQKSVLPSEEAQLHSGICLMIGNLHNSFQVKELFLNLIRFDSGQVYRDIFPEAYDFYPKLNIKVMGLMNFCVKDLINDPAPINYQDRAQLTNRCNEIKEINLNLLDYLDKQFPNK